MCSSILILAILSIIMTPAGGFSTPPNLLELKIRPMTLAYREASPDENILQNPLIRVTTSLIKRSLNVYPIYTPPPPILGPEHPSIPSKFTHSSRGSPSSSSHLKPHPTHHTRTSQPHTHTKLQAHAEDAGKRKTDPLGLLQYPIETQSWRILINTRPR